MTEESILIDLREYGGEGFVEMMYPPYSRIRQTDNIVTGLMLKVDKDGNVSRDMSGKADAILIKTLSYVESAPFDRTIDSFLAYTDELDRKKRRNGERLFKAMTAAVEKIDEGETSPSADSPAAENESSA